MKLEIPSIIHDKAREWVNEVTRSLPSWRRDLLAYIDQQQDLEKVQVRALWAVKVLDRARAKIGREGKLLLRENQDPEAPPRMRFAVCLQHVLAYGETEDLARITAAEMLVAEDSTLESIK